MERQIEMEGWGGEGAGAGLFVESGVVGWVSLLVFTWEGLHTALNYSHYVAQGSTVRSAGMSGRGDVGGDISGTEEKWIVWRGFTEAVYKTSPLPPGLLLLNLSALSVKTLHLQ